MHLANSTRRQSGRGLRSKLSLLLFVECNPRRKTTPTFFFFFLSKFLHSWWPFLLVEWSPLKEIKLYLRCMAWKPTFVSKFLMGINRILQLPASVSALKLERHCLHRKHAVENSGLMLHFNELCLSPYFFFLWSHYKNLMHVIMKSYVWKRGQLLKKRITWKKMALWLVRQHTAKKSIWVQRLMEWGVSFSLVVSKATPLFCLEGNESCGI